MPETCLLLKRIYALQIFERQKRVEARPMSKTFEALESDQIIKFHWCNHERLVTRLVKKTVFQNVRDMLTSLGVDACLPGKTLEEACAPQPQAVQWTVIYS